MLPLSFSQRRLWFINRLDPASGVYNVPLVFRLRGDLDQDALAAALTDVVDRHESLRTVVDDAGPEPGQVILEPETLGPVLTTAVGEPGAALATYVARGFDLAREIPLRASLFVVGDDEFVLCVVVHHFAFDGLSVGPLLRDLRAAYEARSAGMVPDFTPLPVQYADYALWQREVLGDENDPRSVLSRQLDYWRSALAGLPEMTMLPADRGRPANRSWAGGTVAFELPAELHRTLADVARSTRATVFMVMQAGLAVLLSRLGAGEDVPIGTVTAGRSDGLLDGLVGVFMNTLVLRTDVSGDPSFVDLVGRVREADLAAFAHQDLPFERLVETLNPKRVPGVNPLFQVVLEVHSGRVGQDVLKLGPVVAEPVAVTRESAKVDLTVTAFERYDAAGRPAGADCAMEFATDLFDRPTVEVLAERFVRVLSALAAAPTEPVGKVVLLSEPEQHKIITEWNHVPLDLPDLTLPELFAAQAARTPGALALSGMGRVTVTYAELVTRVNRLANHLRSLGVGPETFVGVCVEPGVDVFVALLGVLTAGGAYVPLDPTQPLDRLSYVIDDAGVNVVVTQENLLGLVAGFDGTLVCVDRDADAVARCSAAPPEVRIDGDNLVYAMYTSGSTGRPKGVLVSHRGLVNYLWWAIDGYGADTGELGAPMLGSIAFDLSIPNLFLPLIVGKCVTLLAQERDLSSLAALLQGDHDYSLLKITPGHLDVLRVALPRDARITSVRTFVVGADEVRPETVAAWRAVAPKSTIIDEYGPTETVVGCSIYTLGEDFDPSIPVSIGRPIANTRMYVLDRWLSPVPVGVAGELFIAGTGVARGYLNRRGLTAERFVADPYGPPGSRMYRTGDLARFRANGDLEFLGRMDHQVKIRGFRVELGEIEARLLVHPGVADAVVVAREDVEGHKRLAAYVVLDPECGATVEQLREHLAELLPAYMLPSTWTELDAMPLTSAGKVDRAALPEPRSRGRERSGRTAANPRQRLLLELFGRTLGRPVDDLSIDDNFFTLGGHSLLAVRLMDEIRQAFQVELALGVLFEAGSVAELAERLDSGNTRVQGLLPIRATGTGIPVFCVHPSSGVAWAYYELARALPSDWPVYGIQALPDRALPASIEDMADQYIDRIQTIQPAGPYRLAGWCFGGVVAHAMAGRLRQRGEEVELLALIGPHPLGLHETLKAPEERATLLALAREFGVDAGPEPDRDTVAEALAGGPLRSRGIPDDRVGDLVDLAVHLDRIEWTYQPREKSFDGAAVLVNADHDFDGDTEYLTTSWQPYVSGGLTTHNIDCANDDLLSTPHAERVGVVLTNELARHQAGRRQER